MTRAVSGGVSRGAGYRGKRFPSEGHARLTPTPSPTLSMRGKGVSLATGRARSEAVECGGWGRVRGPRGDGGMECVGS